MAKLKTSQEQTQEDVSVIIPDIKELQSKYLGIVDKLRSISKPSNTDSSSFVNNRSEESQQSLITRNNFNDLQINSSRPLESRCHCFYRMLGLPVVAPDGSMYNPGFEPNSTLTLEKREKINQTIRNNQSLITIMNQREQDVQTRRNIFVRQDLNSTVYALASRYVRSFSEYFNQSTMGTDPLSSDPQKYTIKDRSISAANLTGTTSDFKTASHILRPFICNPAIVDTVIPAENIICVPFLASKEDTRIDVDKPLLRPGIEYICRQRLQNSTQTDDIFLNEVKRLINGEAANDDSLQDVRNTILALTGAEDLSVLKSNPAFLNTVSKFNTVQVQTINTLIKTIKKVIDELDHATRVFDTINQRINFQPVSNSEGPEFGGSIRVSGGLKPISEFDQKIAVLKVLALNAQLQQKKMLDSLGGGSEIYAITTIDVAQRNYDEEIAALTRQRDELANLGTDALSIIEMITGEVSGLGLIDVLVVYMAFFSIQDEVLIGFLDDSSFNKMYVNNPELRTQAVEARHSGSIMNGLDVLKAFEIRLFNIFSFVDRLYDQKRSSPLENIAGEI